MFVVSVACLIVMAVSVQTKLESIQFSGSEDDFVMFCEQFEARMYLLRLFGVLNGSEGVESCRPKARSGSSREERQVADENAAEIFADKKYKIWCELVQCLDKKSLLFVRSSKGDGPAAWKALCDRFKSFERPRLQQLIEKLTSLRKDQNETIVDYITRAEDLQYNLSQVDEALSEQMFISILLKGLPKDFETFCALVKFTKETKSLDEVKRDLINFDTDRRKPRAEETTFLSRNEVKCHLCGGPGHESFECTQKARTETKQTKSFGQPRVFFKCSKPGHIAKFCPSQVTSRDSNHRMPERFCNHCKKKGHTLSTCFKLRGNQSNRGTDEARLAVQQDDSGKNEEVQFSFFANEDIEVSNNDLVVDSGCTNHMIKDRKLFAELNEEIEGVVGCANKTESKLCGKGRAVFCVKDSEGNARRVELRDALYVPAYDRNLVSLARLRKVGVEIRFGEENSLTTSDGTKFHIEQENNLFVWRIVPDLRVTKHETCLSSKLSKWHDRLGHNNWEDLKKLKEQVVGMDVCENDVFVCEVCEVNKAKRRPVPKDCITRAKEPLDYVHYPMSQAQCHQFRWMVISTP